MKLSEKEKREMREKRKMLNKAWDKGHWERWWHETGHLTKSDVRYRDVTKILKEAEPPEVDNG